MKYAVAKLKGRMWHKFVIHKLRHGEKTKKSITTAKEFCQRELEEDEWMFHVVNYDECAVIYIFGDEAAILFQLACIFHAKDIRGKAYWGASS